MSRFKIEGYLHILLPKKYEYHHVDVNRKNNQIENIIVLKVGDHKKLHAAIRKNPDLKERKYLSAYLREERITKYFFKPCYGHEWNKEEK